MHIGLSLNADKQSEGLDIARRIYARFMQAQVEVHVTEPLAGLLSVSPMTEQEVAAASDVFVVLGGDGTVLRAVGLCAPHHVPVLGVNLGQLGFLAEIEPAELTQRLDQLLKHEYFIEHRMMLEVCVGDQRFSALNDIVIGRTIERPVLRADVYVEQAHLTKIVSDGLIVSSPTGSTAYALSCGGPVVAPTVDCMLLVPVCAHSLDAKPVVLPTTEQIVIELHGQLAHVVCDGRDVGTVTERVYVRRSHLQAQFIRFEHRNFYAVLRQKMAQWT